MNVNELRQRWSDLDADQPMPLIDRRRIFGERMMISEVVLHEGFRIDAHAHDNEQFAVVLEGRIRFRIGESEDQLEELIVEGGEVLHLPSGVWHGAEALETSRVLDLFSPPSESTGVDQQA